MKFDESWFRRDAATSTRDACAPRRTAAVALVNDGLRWQLVAMQEPFRDELEQLRARSLLRRLREIGSAQGPSVELVGQHLVNFSSNDYLGLAADERLRAAATHAIEQFGVGAGASRLVSLYPAGSSQKVNGLKQIVRSHRQHGVQLNFKRAGLRDGGADTAQQNLRADLDDHFAHHRIYLARHDGRTRLGRRQFYFAQPAAWTGALSIYMHCDGLNQFYIKKK